MEKHSGNWETYFKRWGWVGVKDLILRPRMDMKDRELMMMTGEQILIHLSKIKEEDAARYWDAKDAEERAKQKT